MEDAAPTRAQLAATAPADAGTAAVEPAPSAATRMGLPTVLPSARPIPETRDFVATGASRTGEFPRFEALQSANSQLSDAEKRAAEKQMADLLRARAGTPSAQMTYAERRAYLRKVAATHAAEAEAEIVK
ncbi:hypothetical protein [Hoeflea marina]|uniref:hypothetical protein n=1 Tax=Hoeflea marina TaxID=274592 RepID=UPI0011B7A580|nr:hypothetical protein [Hoeflea marina]